MSETTEGFLLDGRIRYAQPRAGFRSGIEPVLLAAAVPAQPGARVLEGGSGAGAALLCLAHRVGAGLCGTGIECDPALAALARRNALANGFEALAFEVGRVEEAAGAVLYDHALANPPYHPDGGTASPDADRLRSKQAPAGLIGAWIAALARRLRGRGTLSLILPAAAIAEATQAMGAAGCGSIALFPLWPKNGLGAKLVLMQSVRSGRGPFRLLPGLALHDARGGYTEAAAAVLRGGGPLALAAAARHVQPNCASG